MAPAQPSATHAPTAAALPSRAANYTTAVASSTHASAAFAAFPLPARGTAAAVCTALFASRVAVCPSYTFGSARRSAHCTAALPFTGAERTLRLALRLF